MCVRARVLNPKGREYISNEQNEMGHFDPSNGGICVRKRGVFFFTQFRRMPERKISRDVYQCVDFTGSVRDN